MPRKARHQTGTVILKKREGKNVWHGQYTDADGRRPLVPLLGAKNKSEAKTALAKIIAPINQARADKRDPNISLGAYTEKIYIPFAKGKWKGSTLLDTPGRMKKHIILGELGAVPIAKLDLNTIQAFLTARGHLSASMVGHLRFDFRAIMRNAVANGFLTHNPAEGLFTPKACRKTDRASLPVMTFDQIRDGLAVLDLRERTFCRIAIFAGCRPGEIIAMKWNCLEEKIAWVVERIYRGVTDAPKGGRARDAGLTNAIMTDLALWRQFSGNSEYVFPSEKGTTAIWYQNLWRRHIRPRFEKIGLEWADFRCMRRTNATLMDKHGINTKVAADQRGHDVGVSITEYTQSSREQKSEAVAELERMFNLSAPQDQATKAVPISGHATGVQL